MSTTADIVVVGGGIVGLAAARALLGCNRRLRVTVIEKESRLAGHQTSHNSGVIHSGVYYRPASLKARMCVEGAEAMQRYCRDRGLHCEVRGKFIVARRPQELRALAEIAHRGAANGVPGLRMMEAAEFHEHEPAVVGLRALHVPSVAIVSFASVAASYAAEIGQAGGQIRTGTELLSATASHGAVTLETNQGTLSASHLLNCAGLHADRVWRLCGGRPNVAVVPFRGEYLQLVPSVANQIRHLIYPVPDPRFPFLGVHLTPRFGGVVEAGPSAVMAWSREGYSPTSWNAHDMMALLTYRGFWAMAARYWRKGLVEQYRSVRRAAFVQAIREFLPTLRQVDVRPGGSGVRAQVVLRNGRLMDDFHVVREGPFLHVLNVPSPAATASLIIGRYLCDRMVECL